jgi:NADH-quinone oxidoreductase subunit K
MFTVTLQHYLALGAVVFCLGVLTMMVKRNAIGVLIGVELLLNAANINLVAFNRYAAPGALDGQVTAIFVIVLAAAEAAVAIAILVNFYNNLITVDVDQGDRLKG